jgi:hypothetical protein
MTMRRAYTPTFTDRTFEQWLGFLQHVALCTVAPNGNYILTPSGRAFLRYIIDMRLPVSKPF